MSTVDPLQGLACPYCAGLGKVPCEECALVNGARTIVCEECDGDGEYDCIECLCGTPHLAECSRCKGEGGWDCTVCDDGFTRCTDCDGTGNLHRVRDSHDAAQIALEVPS